MADTYGAHARTAASRYSAHPWWLWGMLHRQPWQVRPTGRRAHECQVLDAGYVCGHTASAIFDRLDCATQIRATLIHLRRKAATR